MSRFGWAYVNPEMTGAVANGPDKSIQFASGSSQKISGSSNLTFDYTTNTLYLTGTLRADTLIVSASQILKSGSTIFGDDLGDTHQFTGSVYNNSLVSGTLAQFTLISGSTVTGSTARFTTITGSTITATLITGSSLVVSASVISASTYLGITAGSTTPGGTNTNIQFNSGSTFSGSSNFTYNYSTNNVSLTGALLMSGTSYISEVDYIDFDVAASTPSYKNGRVFWNNTDGCLNVYNAEADVTLQVGQENWTRVRNNTGTTVTNGTVVRIIGAQGDAPTIEKAQSVLKSGSINIDTQILGVATHDIEDSSFGYVTTQGLVRGLNTNAFADGETLFVGTGSAGSLQNTAPVAPYEIIPVGVCVKASPGTSGIIYVAVQQPLDFSDLSSVYVSGTYAYGDIWTYVSSSNRGYWTHTNQLTGSYSISGSLTVLGLLSSSVGIQTAGAITSQSIVSSSLGFKTNATVEAAGNITSQATISSSSGLQTGGALIVSGAATIRGGLTVTGSSFVQALSSSGQIQAASLRGDGFNITGIEGSNVNGVGDDYSIQFKDVSTGTLTGSANLLYNTNNTLQISASAIVYPTSTKTGSFSIGPTDYFVFVSGTAVTGTFGASTTGRVIRIYNYGLDTVFLTASGISGFIGSGGSSTPNITQGTNPRTTELMYFSTTNRWLVISTGN